MRLISAAAAASNAEVEVVWLVQKNIAIFAVITQIMNMYVMKEVEPHILREQKWDEEIICFVCYRDRLKKKENS